MPDPVRRPRPRRRLAAAITAGALLGVAALGAPSSASAYEQHFCQYVTLPSTGVCRATTRHTLQSVEAFSITSQSQRVCAASFTSASGVLNSDWRCGYGSVIKSLYGDVDGVGAIRNGDPLPIVGYGVQEF